MRGRYGMKAVVDHEGEAGDVGLGSVLRLRFGGFRGRSMLRVETEFGLGIRRAGAVGGTTGDEETRAGRNSSIRSVSGTGSMSRLVIGGWRHGWNLGPTAVVRASTVACVGRSLIGVWATGDGQALRGFRQGKR